MNAIKDWLVPKAQAFTFSITPAPQTGNIGVGNVVDRVLSYVFIIAGALAIIYLIYSGILYITAAGNPDAAKKGQQGVINAIIGIVVIVLAYFIAQAAVGIGTGLNSGTAS